MLALFLFCYLKNADILKEHEQRVKSCKYILKWWVYDGRKFKLISPKNIKIDNLISLLNIISFKQNGVLIQYLQM